MHPPPGQPGQRPPKRSLLRNLGVFFGHIAHGVKTPVQPGSPGRTTPQPLQNQPDRQVVRQRTQEQEVLTPEGKVVLRRTVIDEIERIQTTDPPPGP